MTRGASAEAASSKSPIQQKTEEETLEAQLEDLWNRILTMKDAGHAGDEFAATELAHAESEFTMGAERYGMLVDEREVT